MSRNLAVSIESWPLLKPFTISRSSISEVTVVVATVTEQGCIGRGECRPYPRYGETPEGVVAAIEAQRDLIEGGGDCASLQRSMEAGAARNAADCALWDLRAKLSGTPAWQLAGLSPPKPCLATYTLGLDTPDRMAAEARRVERPLLKLKLGAPGDAERLQAIRQAVPETRLIVDANEGWTADSVGELLALCARLGIELVEQPLPAGNDAALRGLDSPVALCADESCHTSDDLDGLCGTYEFVSIKLDKAGGLTEALRVAERADALGFGLFVSCMMATSLAMAPASLLNNRARYVDLDAPLMLARDHDPPIAFDGAMMQPPDVRLWG